MKRFVIEREIAGVGRMKTDQRIATAAKSNEALAQLGGKAQWIHSYITDDKTFCVYMADSEDSVREHARLSGFPANKITEVHNMLDPMTTV